MHTTVLNDTGSVAYLPHVSAAVVTGTGTKAKDVEIPTSPVVKVQGRAVAGIEPWGSDNLFPQTVIKEYMKSIRNISSGSERR